MQRKAKIIIWAFLAIWLGLFGVAAYLESSVELFFAGAFWALIIGGSTLYKPETYINPRNGHEEHICGWSYLLVVFFGIFYYAVKRAWRYCFGIILNVLLLALVIVQSPESGIAGLLVAVSWFLWAVLVQRLMRNHYGRIGWQRAAAESV